tara:strand:+ start:5613 stop:5774 length:162 start_codon:yes stop_codon:yes gene_type:complete
LNRFDVLRLHDRRRSERMNIVANTPQTLLLQELLEVGKKKLYARHVARGVEGK